MRPRIFAVCITVFCAATIGAFLISNAGAGLGGEKPDVVRVSSLTEPFEPTRAQREDLDTLRAQLLRADPASTASSVEIPDARPVRLPGGLGTAWVASAPDGGVCTFIPDPLGGFGSSCATQADLSTGGSITVLGGAGKLSEEVVAVLVVPDGGATPVVTTPDGTRRSEPVPGVGATLVPVKSRVAIGGVSLTVPESDTQ